MMIRLLWKSASLILFFVTLTLFVGGLVLGAYWIQPAAESAVERETDKEIAKVEKSAPSMAQSLRELQADYDPRTLFVAIRSGKEGSAFGTVATLAERYSKGLPMPGMELARIASDPNLCQDRDQREAFLVSHGTALQLLLNGPNAEPLREYLSGSSRELVGSEAALSGRRRPSRLGPARHPGANGCQGPGVSLPIRPWLSGAIL
jgi:hypothetical protein